MAKKILFFILLFLIGNSCRKPTCPDPDQETEVEIAIIPEEVCEKVTNWDIRSGVAADALIHLEFRTNDLGYIGGYSGIFMKTNDGGENFEFKNMGTTEDVNAMDFVNDTLGFVATNIRTLSSGVSHLYRTPDGGETFTSINIGAAMFYRALRFINKDIGFAGGGRFPWSTTVDGILMKTTDGGNSWIEITVPGLKPVTEIIFLNDMVGYTCGDQGQVFKTVNGGNNWTNITPSFTAISGVQDILALDIEFLDDTIGYYTASSKTQVENFIFKTTNGGNTWIQLPGFPSGESTEYYLNSIEFVSKDIGYITCGLVPTNEGIILGTTDGGLTWTKDLTVSGRFTRMDARGCKNIFILGGSNGNFVKVAP